ncbi:MAG TPA: hypothetical protein VIX82_01035 [Solirubrobacteraceae bacterium]
MSEPLGAGLEEPRDRLGAFPRLEDDQRARLRAIGELRAVRSGDILLREGEAGYDFVVIESGAVAIAQGYGRENRVASEAGARGLRLRAGEDRSDAATQRRAA